MKSIALILDPRFGPRLVELARTMPVWIVSSEQNDSAVEQARSRLDAAADITTLSPAKGETVANVCLRALYAIEEHHGPSSFDGPYQQVQVFGGDPSAVTPPVMQELGFKRINKSSLGFSLEK